MIDGVAINPATLQREQAAAGPTAGHERRSRVRWTSRKRWSCTSGDSRWVKRLRSGPAISARRRCLASCPKSLLIFSSRKGDQKRDQPGTSAILRAGNLADRTVHYRHDLAFAEDATIPRNPHDVMTAPMQPERDCFARSSQGVQRPDRCVLCVRRHGGHPSRTSTLLRGACRGTAPRRLELHPVATRAERSVVTDHATRFL